MFWQGSAFGGVKGRSGVPALVEQYLEGAITITPYITHQFKLDEINKAFDLMHQGKSIRSVIYY